MIKLGDKVQDKISGLTGIAVEKVEYLNGCVQFGIQPKLKKDQTDLTVWRIDEAQLKEIGVNLKIKKKPTGGPSVLSHGYRG